MDIIIESNNNGEYSAKKSKLVNLSKSTKYVCVPKKWLKRFDKTEDVVVYCYPIHIKGQLKETGMLVMFEEIDIE